MSSTEQGLFAQECVLSVRYQLSMALPTEWEDANEQVPDCPIREEQASHQQTVEVPAGATRKSKT